MTSGPQPRPTHTSTIYRRPDRGGVFGLFTDHLLSKLVALLFAGVIVVIIDRELDIRLFDQDVDVRVGSATAATTPGGRRSIVLEAEPGLALRSVDQAQVHVSIDGPRKLRDLFQRGPDVLGHVTLVRGWLLQGASGRTMRTVDGKDLDVGVPGVTVSMPTKLQVEIDEEATAELKLAGVPKDVGSGLAAAVVFDPPTIKIAGARSWFTGQGALERVLVPVNCLGRKDPFKMPVTALPDDLTSRYMRLVPGQRAQADVTFSAAALEPLLVDRVPLKLSGSPGRAVGFTVLPPLDSERPTVNVRLAGPPELVRHYTGDPVRLDELRRSLRAEVDTDALAARMTASTGTARTGDPPPGPLEESVEVEIMRLPDGLKLVSVEPSRVDVAGKR